MSIEMFGLAKRRAVGSAMAKAVLLIMADSASEDGSGIWISKANIARDLEVSKRAVQNAVQALQDMGIIAEVGQRSCKNGFTIEYRIVPEALLALPSTRESPSPVTRAGDSPVQEIHPYPCTTFTPTHAGDSPKPSLEPSIEPSVVREAGPSDLFSAYPEPQPQSEDDQFEDFWAAFPKKPNSSKKNARMRWKGAVRKETPERLIRAARSYARSREGEDPKFTKAAEFWLNGECWAGWLDQPEQKTIAPSQSRFGPRWWEPGQYQFPDGRTA